MPEFRREHHRIIASLLSRLNAKLLLKAQCYFGGGTQIALALDEYRESRDIDFLCASRTGFRLLRESVTQESLGPVLSRPIRLAREVRADRDGIRTFFESHGTRIKFEIVLEARIDLAGSMNPELGIPALDLDSMVAEKLLANADRGMDQSTHARDLVDLAFLAAAHGSRRLQAGAMIAQEAYGAAIRKDLQASLTAFSSNRTRATGHLKALGISDATILRKGLRVLKSLTKV